MSFFYDDSIWIAVIIAGITVMSYVFYLYDKKRRLGIIINKVPGPKPILFFGNILPLFRASFEGKGEKFSSYYNSFEKLWYILEIQIGL